MSSHYNTKENWKFERLIQPDDWSCYPQVACMIVGVDYKTFLAFNGHDGSEILYKDREHPKGRRCFTDSEITKFLAHFGITTQGPYYPDKNAELDDVFYKEYPASLCVKSRRFEGSYHAVLWTGEHVLDPSPKAKELEKLEDYEIISWDYLSRDIHYEHTADRVNNLRLAPSIINPRRRAD